MVDDAVGDLPASHCDQGCWRKRPSRQERIGAVERAKLGPLLGSGPARRARRAGRSALDPGRCAGDDDSPSWSPRRTDSDERLDRRARAWRWCNRISSGYRGAPNRSTRNSRIGTPSRARVTPSAFQNAVAASSFPARRSATALKPIVTRCDARGSSHRRASTESRTASSEGSPVTPTVLPARSLGVRIRRGPGDHRRQRSLDDRRDADDIEPPLAGDREVVDVEDRKLRPAGLEQLGSVGRRRWLLDVEVHPRRRGSSPRRARHRSLRGPRSAGSRAPGSRLFGAPGSAPPPPQAARPADARTAASSATTRFIEARSIARARAA